MKIRNLALSFSVLLIIVQCCFSQQAIEPVLISELGKPCSEELARDYDVFLVELNNDPAAMGYIIFYGEAGQEGTNLRYIDYLRRVYPSMRGFDRDRINFVRGYDRDKMHFEFWKVSPGASIPVVSKEFKLEKISAASRFQKVVPEIQTDSGSSNGFVDSFLANWGCDFAPNFKDFAVILTKEKDLSGYLVIRAKKKNARKIKTLALEELTRIFKVSRKRLKIVFGDETEEPELELWLVPQGETFLVK